MIWWENTNVMYAMNCHWDKSGIPVGKLPFVQPEINKQIRNIPTNEIDRDKPSRRRRKRIRRRWQTVAVLPPRNRCNGLAVPCHRTSVCSSGWRECRRCPDNGSRNNPPSIPRTTDSVCCCRASDWGSSLQTRTPVLRTAELWRRLRPMR